MWSNCQLAPRGSARMGRKPHIGLHGISASRVSATASASWRFGDAGECRCGVWKVGAVSEEQKVNTKQETDGQRMSGRVSQSQKSPTLMCRPSVMQESSAKPAPPPCAGPGPDRDTNSMWRCSNPSSLPISSVVRGCDTILKRGRREVAQLLSGSSVVGSSTLALPLPTAHFSNGCKFTS